MKESIKIKNEYGFWIPLITQGYKKIPNKDQFLGIININEQFILGLSSKIEKEDSFFMHLDRSFPMCYKPAKWRDYEIGGYYLRPTNFMRTTGS